MTDVRMLKLEEVMQITGLGRSTLYALVKSGGFPRQVQLGPRAVRWDSRAVEKWLAEKLGQGQEAA